MEGGGEGVEDSINFVIEKDFCVLGDFSIVARCCGVPDVLSLELINLV